MIYKKLTYEFLLICNVIPNKPTYLIIVTLIFEWLGDHYTFNFNYNVNCNNI